MDNILNQKTRSFFDEVDLFKQTANNNVLFPDLKKINSFKNNIYYGETIRGMTHVSPILQKPLVNAYSHEIAASYYIDAEKIKKNKHTLISDVGVDDNFIEFISKDVFHDTNSNGMKDVNEFGFLLKIFVSKSGNKVTESYKVSKANDNELLLFIEEGEDLFSSKKMYARSGKSVLQYIEKNDLYNMLKKYITNQEKTSTVISTEITPLSIDKLKELLNNGYIESTWDVVKSILMSIVNITYSGHDLLGEVLVKIGEWINYLAIGESVWDPSHEEYIFKPSKIEYSVLENIKTLTEKLKIDLLWADKISRLFEILKKLIDHHNAYVESFSENRSALSEQVTQKAAYIFGIWNGLIDFISGTIIFIGQILSLQTTIAENRENLVEQLDDFMDLLSQPDLFEKLEKGFNTFIESVKKEFLNKDAGLDMVKVHYVAGFSIAFIATFFIPIANIAKIEKLGKTGKILSEILEMAGAKLAQTKEAIKEITQTTVKTSLKAMQEVMELISKGGDEFLDFVRNLAKKIADWFLKNKKTVSLVDEIDTFLITLITILKKNPKYLDSLQYIKFIRRPLGRFLALEQEAAINLYTKSYYILFNRALRKIEGKMTMEFKAMQKVLDSALEKLPIFNQGKNPLLRSTYFSEESVKKLFKVGGDFTDAGYFSTTYSEKALLRWMKQNPKDNVLFKVYGKNGKLIEKSSDIIDEAEVLFKSNTTFFVESVEKYYDRKLMREITEIILKEK